MKLTLIIPCSRPKMTNKYLIPTVLNCDIVPDEIIIVSNVMEKSLDNPRFRFIQYHSDIYQHIYKDNVLRRNIGIYEATGDYLIFLDDDQAVPKTFFSDMIRRLKDEKVCWGHHRFVDFRQHSISDFANMDPTIGNPRENKVNDYHTYQSGYNGCFGISRDYMLKLGCYDMIFNGNCTNNDQQLAYRIMIDNNWKSILVNEPPFAWHPTCVNSEDMAYQYPTQDHTCKEHVNMNISDYSVLMVNGISIRQCNKCTYRIPDPDVDRNKVIVKRNNVVIPYDPLGVTLYEL